jgi:hypothetical protein
MRNGEAVPVVTAQTGRSEYNNGSILVRSHHPLDECLRRGIIEDQHHDSGRRIMALRDCGLPGQLSGGAAQDGEGGVDAATL